MLFFCAVRRKVIHDLIKPCNAVGFTPISSPNVSTRDIIRDAFFVRREKTRVVKGGKEICIIVCRHRGKRAACMIAYECASANNTGSSGVCGSALELV